MLEVVPAVRQLVPGLLTGARPSVACVATTRPKYLVFDTEPERPRCVVDFGAADRLVRVHRILMELSSRYPGGVPRSLLCARWRDDTYVQIQEGLPGVPWFRVSDSLVSSADWRNLLDRAVAAMARLHAAIGAVPAWKGRVSVRAELEKQAGLCVADAVALSPELLRRVREWGVAFDRAGPVQAVWQHGDFSLNNLLVSPGSLAIIDFDEFGETLIPLHDAFGLALSFQLSQQAGCPLSRIDCINACVAPSLTSGAIEGRQLPGLLMHHLLWRINQCRGLDRRAALQARLLGWAEELAAAPSAFLGERTPKSL